MNRILYIGIDVHSTNFTFASLERTWNSNDRIFAVTQTAPDFKNVLRYITNVKKQTAEDAEVVCGYEAGCLGYTLYRQLTACHITCHILAPSTMPAPRGQRIKTDSRDARNIAQCLANGTYSPVYVPSRQDEAVKGYIRMRDDHKSALKRIKQQINAFCLYKGFSYGKTRWTRTHQTWCRKLPLEGLEREIMTEYLETYQILSDKIDRLDKRIEELAQEECYREKAGYLTCLLGIKIPTALALLVETGDFRRFRKGDIYAAYLGLAPGEHSSGEKAKHLGITRTGNGHLRRLLTESAQGICKGQPGYKSKELKARQWGKPAEIVGYADRANLRMRKKYRRMMAKEKKRNVAVTAIARELACFVWGMMTENIE